MRRKLLGYVWLTTWIAILYVVAAPWRRLGGLESELLRWLEWWALFGGTLLGFAIGRAARAVAEEDRSRTWASLLRVLLYPPGAVTAVSLLVLDLTGARGPVGVVFTAFLAYWAGLDLAFGALPLMEGKPFTLSRPLPKVPFEGTRGIPSDWAPPWERF